MLTADRPQLPAAATAEPAHKAWPTVEGHWLLGCLRDVQRRPLELYREAWQQHGDLVRIHILGNVYMYMLAHPDAIEHVLHTRLKNYRKPDSFNDSVRPLAGKGILTSEGEFWRKQRRLVQPAFLRNSVNRLGGLMIESIDRFVGEWEREPDGRTLDVLPEMMRLGLRIASTTLLGTDISSDADSIGGAYRNAFEYASLKMNGRLMFQPLWLPTPRNRQFKRSKALLDRVVLDLVAKRRSGQPKGDVLDLLLAAQDEESGVGMSDEQLKDEALTLLTAGHETVGAALSWTWYLLGKHPEVQQALHEQASARLQGRLPGVEDLAAMPLVTAVFEESMRLYPPAWGMPRETIEPDVICGYPIPAKATVMTSQHLIHRHPAFWPRPDEFDPSRFLPENTAGRPKFAYFPFGGGPRICIGNHFAMVEGPLALAALAQRFHFTLVPDQQVVPDPTFTLRPKYGVRMVVRKRT